MKTNKTQNLYLADDNMSQKRAVVSVRLSMLEHRILRDIAERLGETQSDLLRRCIWRVIDEENKK